MDDASDKGGRILFLNGASSSGKSTLAKKLQTMLDEPYWHYSIDHLLGAEIVPRMKERGGNFEWKAMRANFFEGFHRSIPAFARANNNIIVEHIIEEELWLDRLLLLLKDFKVLFVGLNCPVEELIRREAERGDRQPGSAENDSKIVHRHCCYDVELESTADVEINALRVIEVLEKPMSPTAMARMIRARHL